MKTLFEELSAESGIKSAVAEAWGTKVHLRSMNALEIIEYHEHVDAAPSDDRKVQGIVLLVHTLESAPTEEGGTGERIAKADYDKFVKLFGAKDFRTVQVLVKQARELNGLGLASASASRADLKNA